jgi:hypothetical protein
MNSRQPALAPLELCMAAAAALFVLLVVVGWLR